MDETKDQPKPEGVAEPVEIAATELAELQRRAAQADELREQMLRARADYANLQKRQAREMEEFRKHALQDFVMTLLPALDDLREFLRAAGTAPSSDPMRQAVEIAVGKIEKALRNAGVRPVPAEGQPFDPTIHHAVDVQSAPHLEIPTVSEEVRAGYVLGDRLIRPAQVRVAMPPKPGEGTRKEAEDETGT